jgi:hypothetical protein
MLRALGIVGLALAGFGTSPAQDLTVRIKVSPSADLPRAQITGGYRAGSKRWAFPNTLGSLLGLGLRIKDLKLKDANDQYLIVRTLGPGEFSTENKATEFSYEVDLKPPAKPADAAHVSWLNTQHGYLMLADLVPELGSVPMCVELELPQNWVTSSSVSNATGKCYEVTDKAGAVFFVGNDLKQKTKRTGSSETSFVSAGEWPFSRDAALERAARIIKEYTAQTGFQLARSTTIMLAEFPGASTSQGWSAETRGQNLILLAGRNPRKPFSLGQLSVALCHELFHRWVPNSLRLTGDYDWFFEGFTLYQALCTAVKLKVVDFEEYLETLGRVYASYLAAEHGKLSLIEASQRRWTSGSTLVYDQGMLVAFLFDLKLRKSSHNQLNLDTVYQQLFREFGSGAPPIDGNEALIALLVRIGGDAQFVKSYIQSPEVINLNQALSPYSMVAVDLGKRWGLGVVGPLKGEQYELLKELGYRKR